MPEPSNFSTTLIPRNGISSSQSRIQVEHTVTEMVTGIDLVRSQILLPQGHKLHESPMDLPHQQNVPLNGAALQCRVTTEDPENNFSPDYGKLSTYRSPAGFGIRLDGGTAYAGATLAAYYDSLLVKVTAWVQIQKLASEWTAPSANFAFAA